MKLFNWRNKKLLQTPGQACVHMIIEGSLDTHAGRRHTLVYGENVERHVTNVSIKHAIHATWPQTVEQPWGPEKDTDLYCQFQSGFLAIGILGVNGLENEAGNEARVGDDQSEGIECVAASANMAQLQDQVLVLQNELNGAFSIPTACDESNMSQQHYHILSKEGLGFENKHIDASNGRVGNSKKVFPLKEFLETPFETENNQTTEASYTLDPSMTGSWSGSESTAFEVLKMQKNRAVDSLKRVFSVTRTHLSRALFKLKRTPERSPRDLLYQSNLKKLLDLIFQKPRVMRSRTLRQLVEPGTLADNDSDSCCTDLENPTLCFPTSAGGSKGCISITDEVPKQLEVSSERDSAWLRSSDDSLAHVTARDNEFWINTDDDYVVLEL